MCIKEREDRPGSLFELEMQDKHRYPLHISGKVWADTVVANGPVKIYTREEVKMENERRKSR